MRATATEIETVRAQVLPLALERVPYREIAERLKLSPGVVNTTIYRLRKAGKLPPAPPQLKTGSLASRLLDQIAAAGNAGLQSAALRDPQGSDAPSIRKALRHLRKYGLIRREADGLLLAAEAERAPSEIRAADLRSAGAPLQTIVAYALKLSQEGAGLRAADFLDLAAQRLDAGRLPASLEATNLRALADLIRFGEGRTYSGKIVRIEMGGSEA